MSQVQGLILIQGQCCGFDLKILLILICNMSQVKGLTLFQGMLSGRYDLKILRISSCNMSQVQGLNQTHSQICDHVVGILG